MALRGDLWGVRGLHRWNTRIVHRGIATKRSAFHSASNDAFCRGPEPRTVSSSSVWMRHRSRRPLGSTTPLCHPNLPHDLGGNSGFRSPIPVGSSGDDLRAWERECHALFAVLASKDVIKTDQLRRAIEDLTPKQYSEWSYYGRWSAAMATLLLDRGLISDDDLRRSLFGNENNAGSSVSKPPEFRAGDSVRVKSFQDGVEWRRPHIRTPGYVYGVNGRIVDVCGRFGDPSFLALGLEAPEVWLYRVEISMEDLWPEQVSEKNTLSIEVYEHWLVPSDKNSGHGYQEMKLFNHEEDGRDCSHQDVHSHGGNSHDPRTITEKRAVEDEGPPRPGEDFFRGLLQTILDKKIVSGEEVRAMIEGLDSAGRTMAGRDLIARAWMDPVFEERLLEDAAGAALELGIHTSNPNSPTVLTVVKNTSKEHNLIVCTLCSCYPSGLLGIAPPWYKSSEFRSRAVREPREVLNEFGTQLPQTQSIRVHDSTADHRYLVMPQRPKGTGGWSENELKQLVTRDSMLGVALPMAPLE